jgi:hypothetical protein
MAAAGPNSVFWGGTAPTSTNFYVDNYQNTGASGFTYVAYLFAHNAGGFGLTGTDNVISCGSFTTNGSGLATVSLGYEPQWILYKPSNAVSDWGVVDSMRGMPVTSGSAARLYPNGSYAEGIGNSCMPNATGFTTALLTSTDYIYIAIRRGPMKVPTDGTTVFSPIARTGTGATASITSAGFPPDLVAIKSRNAAYSNAWTDRLRGNGLILFTDSTVADQNYGTASVNLTSNMGVSLSSETLVNQNGTNYINYLFQRAPSFFDEVCYTGNGSATTQTHNLGAVPEMMIVKLRDASGYNWFVYHSALGNSSGIVLNSTNGSGGYGTALWNSTTPTSTVFSLGTNSNVNGSGSTYVNYLFATCAGVSKVGSYTGTGATQTISCGFTGGARFVLVKRTDSTGDWYVWDTARGMVSGTDPTLLLNSTAAEVNANSIYTATGGFQIVSTAAGINASGGTYIFLAIA